MTKSPEDIESWLLKAYEEKDAAAPPSERALHQDSRLVIIVGSETTATTLTSALFYLAKYPIVQTKLQHQLDRNARRPSRLGLRKDHVHHIY